MAALSRIESESRLSNHSSLQEEEIDLAREKQRKLNRAGQHAPGNGLSLAGAAYAADAVTKGKRTRRKEGYDVASALKVAGGVAIVGMSWTPKEFKKSNKKASNMYSTALATTAVAKAKISRKRDPEKTVARALQTAAAVVIVGASWTRLPKAQPPGLTFEGAATAGRAINKAKKVKKQKEYSIANGLRIAGGIAIAACSWEPKERPMSDPSPVVEETIIPVVPKRLSPELNSTGGTPISYTPLQKQPTLVDMATSPIPQEITPQPPIVVAPVPAAILKQEPIPTPSPDIPFRTETAATPLGPPPQSVVNHSTPSPVAMAIPSPVPSQHTPEITPAPSIPPQPTETPMVVVQPVRTPTPPSPEPESRAHTITPLEPTPQRVVAAPQPRTPERPRSSRGVAPLLVAAAVHNRRKETPVQKAVTPVKEKPPTPAVIEQVATPVAVHRAPTPEEVEFEEIIIPVEEPQTVAEAGTKAKPKRKPLAKLTPLEKLAAKARSLR